MSDRYWVGGGSSTNWDATGDTNWSASSGGANNESVPTTGDDVFFDTEGSDNCVINVHTAALNSFAVTGYTGTFSDIYTLIISPTSGVHSVTFDDSCTWSGPTLGMKPVGVGTVLNFTSGGLTLDGIGPDDGTGSGTINQLDSLTMTGVLNIINGTWNTNGFSITANGIIIGLNVNDADFEDCTVTLAWVGWNLTGGCGFTSTGSTIIAGAKFEGGGETYNIVTLNWDDSFVKDNNTIATLNIDQAGNGIGQRFTAGSTQTVTNFTTNGSGGNLAKILSTSAGNPFYLTTLSSHINVDYMSIKDSIVDEVVTWYAGTNSINVSGNSNWIFTVPLTLSRILGIDLN